MIPILRAPVHLIRDGFSKEPVNYLAMAWEWVGAGTRLHLYTSANGAVFRKRRVRGDLATFAASGILTYFVYMDVLRYNGALYLAFKYQATPSSPSRPLIFKTLDGIEWNRVPHPLDAASGSLRIVDIAYGAGRICALLNDGRTVISTDGETFTVGASTGIPTPGALSGNGGYLVAAGAGGELRVSSAPQTGWTKYDSKFGTGLISNIAAGNVFMALGSSVSTAALTGPTAWTLRSTVNSDGKYQALYRPGRWFIAGTSAESFVTATDALSFSTPAEKYWTGDFDRIWSWMKDDAGVMALYGSGRIARSDAGTAWTQVANNGLPPMPFQICAHLGN